MQNLSKWGLMVVLLFTLAVPVQANEVIVTSNMVFSNANV